MTIETAPASLSCLREFEEQSSLNQAPCRRDYILSTTAGDAPPCGTLARPARHEYVTCHVRCECERQISARGRSGPQIGARTDHPASDFHLLRGLSSPSTALSARAPPRADVAACPAAPAISPDPARWGMRSVMTPTWPRILPLTMWKNKCDACGR